MSSDSNQDLKDLIKFFDNLSENSKDHFHRYGNVKRWNSTVVNESFKKLWHNDPIRVEPKIYGKWFDYSAQNNEEAKQ